MKRAFRDNYNRELALLKERAREFAQDYPGLADRLGGLLEENLDPTVAGLLEGSAFLAARVQLKMQEEFRTFTHEYLEQIFPDALAPTPSVMLVQARLPDDLTTLDEGLHFARGEYMDARYVDTDKRVTCRFSLAAPLTLWPVSLTGAVYHGSAGPVGALGQEIANGTKAGLVLDLTRDSENGRAAGEGEFSRLPMDALTLHFSGPMDQATALYEQMLCKTLRVSLRWQNARGDAVFSRLPQACIEQVGFHSDERLFPHQERQFDGFALLREYFVFPRKFLGIRLVGLTNHLRLVKSAQMQIVFEFDTPNPRLVNQIDPNHIALNAAPAVNLFDEISSQVRLDRKRHEFVVTPNSSPMTHYELHGIREVWGFYAGHQTKVQVHHLYAMPPDGQNPRQVLYFTSRRKPRRMTLQERRYGASRYRYRGSETFVSIYEPPGSEPVQRLQVRAICSNRHLPEYLPIAQGKDDFTFCENQTVQLRCIAGPTPPRESIADLETSTNHRTSAGDVYWRLISYLSLSKFGIDSPDPKAAAAAIREMLGLFADLSDSVLERQIIGLQKVATRPVTRTLAHPDGYHTARGLEVTLTFDEDEFEGSGITLLGAVLDRFLAEHVAINSFTQTVLASVQRGQILSFPPRSGMGPIL